MFYGQPAKIGLRRERPTACFTSSNAMRTILFFKKHLLKYELLKLSRAHFKCPKYAVPENKTPEVDFLHFKTCTSFLF